ILSGDGHEQRGVGGGPRSERSAWGPRQGGRRPCRGDQRHGTRDYRSRGAFRPRAGPGCVGRACVRGPRRPAELYRVARGGRLRYLSMASRVSGSIQAPPSKSYTHRAIVLAALSRGPCHLHRPLLAEDTQATIEGMYAFGADFTRTSDGLQISAGPLHASNAPIDARNSGTTLRFLSGVASLFPGATLLTGDASLQKRPMGPLLDALERLGARAGSLAGDGRPPVKVQGVIRGGRASVPGFISSQFLSSLLIACPLAANASEIRVVPPIRSEPYISMTRRAMRAFGVEVDLTENTVRIEGGQSYTPTDVDIPGDFSSAAFPLVAAAITGGDVTVEGLSADSPDGDSRIVDLLRSFGARVDTPPNRVRVRSGDLVGQTVDVGDTPDLFPVLAVLATQADGETRFVHGERRAGRSTSRTRGASRFPIRHSWMTCGRSAPYMRWSDEHLRLAVPDDDLRDEPWPLRGLHDRGAPGRHTDRSAVGAGAARPPSTGAKPPDVPAEGGGSRRVRGRPRSGHGDRRADRSDHRQQRRAIEIVFGKRPRPEAGARRLHRRHEVRRQDGPPRWRATVRPNDRPSRGLWRDCPPSPRGQEHQVLRPCRPDRTGHRGCRHAETDRSERRAHAGPLRGLGGRRPHDRGDRGGPQRSG